MIDSGTNMNINFVHCNVAMMTRLGDI
jgi:hypothetical protein